MVMVFRVFPLLQNKPEGFCPIFLLSFQFSLQARAASNEESRKEVLVQSEMQMAKEDMSCSQSGTEKTSDLY